MLKRDVLRLRTGSNRISFRDVADKSGPSKIQTITDQSSLKSLAVAKTFYRSRLFFLGGDFFLLLDCYLIVFFLYFFVLAKTRHIL